MERLRALPEPQRAAIVMRELEGLSHEEIATALGVSGGAARQAIHRARTTLRDGLGMLLPLPLLRVLFDNGAEAAAGGAVAASAAGGGAGAAFAGLGAGGALKVGAATVLVAGSIGAGVAIDHNHTDRRGPEPAAAAAVSQPPATLGASSEDSGGPSRGGGGTGGAGGDDRGGDRHGRGSDHGEGGEGVLAAVTATLAAAPADRAAAAPAAAATPAAAVRRATAARVGPAQGQDTAARAVRIPAPGLAARHPSGEGGHGAAPGREAAVRARDPAAARTTAAITAARAPAGSGGGGGGSGGGSGSGGGGSGLGFGGRRLRLRRESPTDHRSTGRRERPGWLRVGFGRRRLRRRIERRRRFVIFAAASG